MSATLTCQVRTAAIAFAALLPSVATAEPVKENIGLYGGYVADIAALDHAGNTDVLIAVENSQRGVYRFDTSAVLWVSQTNPSGTSLLAADKTAGYASQIEGDPSTPGLVFATLSNERTDMHRRLFGHTDYGQSVSGTAVWEEITDGTGASYDDVLMLHGSATGMYFAQPHLILAVTGGGSSIDSVFRIEDALSTPERPEDWEIVDFAVVNATSGYVAILRRATNEYRLYDVAFTSGGGGIASQITLPSVAPVEARTGACPISDCGVSVELVAVDPADTSGNTIYIAGSSVNPMVFKSVDGGTTWDEGADFQCAQNPDPACIGGGFFDGYPRGDVVRFKDIAMSGTESRYIFISRSVFDNDTPSVGWQVPPKLSTTIPTSGSPLVVETNTNDPAIELDPNDDSKIYIATDLAIGEITHTTVYSDPAGSELGAAQGIEGLVINDLSYFEISPTRKLLWIATKSGAAFARNYDPTNPSSVATSLNWVYPVFAGGDGAPHRTVIIDPDDQSNVLIGTGSVYRNETGDGLDSMGTYDPSLVAEAGNWTQVFNPEAFAEDPASNPATTDPLFSDNVRRSYATDLAWQTSSAGSCDRVYLGVANTDEGKQGGIFYSDDDGANWQADTLSAARFSSPVNALLSNDNFLWAGLGDEWGRSDLHGLYARVSLCGTSDWWKPSHSDPLFTAIQANDYVVAMDGALTPTESATTARAYIGSNEIDGSIHRLTKAELSSSSSCSGFECWQFTDVTPSTIYGAVSSVAVDPADTAHVWVAYSNCIQESTDAGVNWSDFGGSCSDDHEEVETLVFDELIAGTAQGAYAYTENNTQAADTDGDGVVDQDDAFPDDPAASVDTDGDGSPDDWNPAATDQQIADSELSLDSDDDNDGFTDSEEQNAGSDPKSAESTPLNTRGRGSIAPVLQLLLD